jgi:hypothetical protein
MVMIVLAQEQITVNLKPRLSRSASMSEEIPAHLNPTDDPDRARALRARQAEMLKSNDLMTATIMEGRTRFPDRCDWESLLGRLARIRQAILEWRTEPDEMDAFLLDLQSMTADAAAKVAASASVVMQKIVNTPEEKLADLTEGQRVSHFDLTRLWEEHKESLLGILPIEERKRIEEQ